MKQVWISWRRSGNRSRSDLIAPIVLAGALISFWLFFFFSAEITKHSPSPHSTEPRLDYYADSELLLEVFPDPMAKAGSTYSYIFHFAEDHKLFVGKSLSIDVIHIVTRKKLSPIKSYVITEYDPPEMNMERFIVNCALPLSGMWRFEVRLDGKRYADVLVEIGESSWEVSSTFEVENSQLNGVYNKVGLLNHSFIARQSNKYMWHFWGEEEALDGEFQVLAVKQGSQELIPISAAKSLGGSLRGATRTHSSSMKLPEPGKWMLLPIVDGRLIESIVVVVNERNLPQF
ncbi:DUF4871 domain-containing protein [Paenibacillus sp. GSMTC-2017]|uniref:DUF4871 domain-containing protein n=1 Tax=Paenibacillus sp. GSMTC-2017 TaxID=2794350 RepID=UPI0018D85034|nr:DUF4871 domain-containing protein [Paenibacillus sp. GSMTC-2017]MBH5319974.1 DUF4871 domain-containing protein [Paenibacillus sp. GSMTC-2017]